LPKDNAGLREKLQLREEALEHVVGPLVVLETHAGRGEIGRRLYLGAAGGVAFERDEVKAGILALQRPTWRVYQTASESGLAAGAAADLPFSFVDVDPWGDPWPVVSALLTSSRVRAPRLVLAVNDGLGQKVKRGGAWHVRSLADAVLHFGVDFFDRYLEVARWQLERKAASAGYDVERFAGRSGGHAKQMSHYFAVLTPRAAPPAA